MSSFSNYAHWNNTVSYDYESISQNIQKDTKTSCTNSCACHKKINNQSNNLTEGFCNSNNQYSEIEKTN